MPVLEGGRVPTYVRRSMPGQPSASDMSGRGAATRASHRVTNAEVSPAEALAVHRISHATLRRLLATGDLAARKVDGASGRGRGRGRGWRILVAALERAGYVRRPLTTHEEPDPQAEVRRLRKALAMERAQASQRDGQLGYALLTIGRLRGRLFAAGINPDELVGADLAAASEVAASRQSLPEGIEARR